jgi:uncharacterized iron-regulated protein
MDLPKYLIADNEDFPENIYVVHTQKPRFIVDTDTEEYEILDGSVVTEEAMEQLIAEALEFYEDELDRYAEDDEDDEL